MIGLIWLTNQTGQLSLLNTYAGLSKKICKTASACYFEKNVFPPDPTLHMISILVHRTFITNPFKASQKLNFRLLWTLFDQKSSEQIHNQPSYRHPGPAGLITTEASRDEQFVLLVLMPFAETHSSGVKIYCDYYIVSYIETLRGCCKVVTLWHHSIFWKCCVLVFGWKPFRQNWLLKPDEGVCVCVCFKPICFAVFHPS